MTRTAFALRGYDELASTNDEARRLAERGAPDGTVVHAVRQTAGRGRQGRNWQSPAGNLYASFLLRPGIATERASELGFVAAVAVADLAASVLPDGAVAVKWPNDVLAGGAKLAGILTECAGGAVVIGIGLNVRHAPEGLPYPATCLAAQGCALDADAVLRRLADGMAVALEAWSTLGFAAILESWAARGPAIGAALRVRSGSGQVAGRFAGLDSDGALLLATDQGVRRIVAGDVASAVQQGQNLGGGGR